MEMVVWKRRVCGRQIRRILLETSEEARRLRQANSSEGLPRKASKGVFMLTVSQTDTGRRGEKPKVFERTMEKELGKMAP